MVSMNTAVWSHSAMNTAAWHGQPILGVTLSLQSAKLRFLFICLVFKSLVLQIKQENKCWINKYRKSKVRSTHQKKDP